MRITNNSIVRNYNRNLNANLANLNRVSNQLHSSRKFSSMMEDTSSGVRAMLLRRSESNMNSNIDTAKTVLSQYSSAEGQMMNINALGQQIATRYTNALNGTNSQIEMKTFAEEITQFRDQILNCANGKFSDRYMFGGTNTTERPFTVADNGDLLYNGISVKDMADAQGNMKPEYQYLLDDAYFVDLGLGMGHDQNDQLVESSVFKASLSGLDFLGIGDKNIYNICNEIITALDSGSFTNNEYTSSLLDKMTAAYTNVTLKVTDLGAQVQYLESTVSGYEDDLINLYERQNEIESVDPAEAIMNWKMQEYVYNASLQMGQRLLQPTLFTFIS